MKRSILTILAILAVMLAFHFGLKWAARPFSRPTTLPSDGTATSIGEAKQAGPDVTK